jgi:hypothetical protein
LRRRPPPRRPASNLSRLEVLDTETALAAPSRWLGAVLCHDLPGPGRRPALLKGHRLLRADALALEASGLAELHLLWLEDGDIDEDTAALRLAAAVAGEGIDVGRPVESQVRLSAARRGLLRVDAAALAELNASDGCTVFTLPDGMPVDAGRTLGGAKVTPLAVSEAALRAAGEAAARARGGAALRVLAFKPLRVAALLRERLSDREREYFDVSLHLKVSWFGGTVAGVESLSDGALGASIVELAARSDVLLVPGVTSVDPLETTWRALVARGASEIRRGLPVHPGSSYWIAGLQGCTIIGVGSCGTFARRTALDLLLVRLFAGEALDGDLLAGLGHGGLLASEMAWRFPRYDDGAQESD